MYSISFVLPYVVGVQLLETLCKAIHMAQKHTSCFNQLSEMVPTSVLATWTREINDWDVLNLKKKHTKISPYRNLIHSKSSVIADKPSLKSSQYIPSHRLSLSSQMQKLLKWAMAWLHNMKCHPLTSSLAVFDIKDGLYIPGCVCYSHELTKDSWSATLYKKNWAHSQTVGWEIFASN